MSASRTVRVDLLSRVEGEGGLRVRMRGGRVTDVQLRIFEPPRFFEALLRGRPYGEAPDITARVCGICPVAYQMSAVHAIERLLGLDLPAPLRALRRLLYCGEWIESHALHVFLLHAPDFLGYDDALTMARDHPRIVRDGLRLKQTGNALVAAIGGREIHPVNVRVGGFHRLPRRRELTPLLDDLRRARDLARETVRWAGALEAPDFERDYTLVALRHPDEYPLNEGRITSSRGLDLDPGEWDAHFAEHQRPHSTALHACDLEGGPYLVGPLARYGLNADRLCPPARAAAAEAGLGPVCRNPFRAIVVRAVELLQACDEAVRIVESWQPPETPFVEGAARAGEGQAATEAPRGLLLHRYAIDAAGRILSARIVPPTSQNQATIEDDLRAFVTAHATLELPELRRRCEQVVRNHDPCISCATHFLQVDLEREP